MKVKWISPKNVVESNDIFWHDCRMEKSENWMWILLGQERKSYLNRSALLIVRATALPTGKTGSSARNAAHRSDCAMRSQERNFALYWALHAWAIVRCAPRSEVSHLTERYAGSRRCALESFAQKMMACINPGLNLRNVSGMRQLFLLTCLKENICLWFMHPSVG